MLITIPIILIFNTLYITRSLVDLFNYELRLKAELASSVISITIANDLNNHNLIQGKIGVDSLPGVGSQFTLEFLIAKD